MDETNEKTGACGQLTAGVVYCKQGEPTPPSSWTRASHSIAFAAIIRLHGRHGLPGRPIVIANPAFSSYAEVTTHGTCRTGVQERRRAPGHCQNTRYC